MEEVVVRCVVSEDKVEVNDPEEEGVKDEEEVEETTKIKTQLLVKGIKDLVNHATRLLVTQISLRSSHVFVTGRLENPHIFVWSQHLALGKISTSPNLINEIQTSLAI